MSGRVCVLGVSVLPLFLQGSHYITVITLWYFWRVFVFVKKIKIITVESKHIKEREYHIQKYPIHSSESPKCQYHYKINQSTPF